MAELLLNVVSSGIPGDYVELGVWRGGIGIFARAIFDELSEVHRTPGG